VTNTSRGNAAQATVVAALMISFAQRHMGVVLSTEDALALLGMFAAGWHWFCTVFEKYFPPPQVAKGDELNPT
jgi:hypothetical protein